jgi:hypothetical protein
MALGSSPRPRPPTMLLNPGRAQTAMGTLSREVLNPGRAQAARRRLLCLVRCSISIEHRRWWLLPVRAQAAATLSRGLLNPGRAQTAVAALPRAPRHACHSAGITDHQFYESSQSRPCFHRQCSGYFPSTATRLGEKVIARSRSRCASIFLKVMNCKSL